MTKKKTGETEGRRPSIIKLVHGSRIMIIMITINRVSDSSIQTRTASRKTHSEKRENPLWEISFHSWNRLFVSEKLTKDLRKELGERKKEKRKKKNGTEFYLVYISCKKTVIVRMYLKHFTFSSFNKREFSPCNNNRCCPVFFFFFLLFIRLGVCLFLSFTLSRVYKAMVSFSLLLIRVPVVQCLCYVLTNSFLNINIMNTVSEMVVWFCYSISLYNSCARLMLPLSRTLDRRLLFCSLPRRRQWVRVRAHSILPALFSSNGFFFLCRQLWSTKSRWLCMFWFLLFNSGIETL